MKTSHELACAISALINSSPRSPTIAELEGVIRELADTREKAAVSDKSNALAGLVECADELRGAEEPSNRDIAYRVLEILQEAKVVPKPPMVVVTHRIRDSICLGGVGYGI